MALSDNIVSYWKLDAASGNASDSSASGYTLTNNNTATYGAAVLNNGVTMSAASSQYLSISNASGPSLGVIGNLTIAMWVNLTTLMGTNDGYMLAGKAFISPNSLGYYFYLDDQSGTKNIHFVAGSNGSAWTDVSVTWTPSATTWYHLAVTYNTSGSSNVKFYLNGSQQGATKTNANTSIFNPTTAAFMLGHRNDGVYNYNGKMDEVGVWARELSGSEISQLYNGGAGLSYPFSSSYTKTLTETPTLTATLLKSTSRAFTEALTLTATALKTGGKVLGEALTSTASLLKNAGKLATETITASDTFTRVWTIGRTLTETATTSANILKTAGRLLVETLTLTDSFTKGFNVSAGPNSPGTMADDATYGTIAWSNPNNAMAADGLFATALIQNTIIDYGALYNFVRIVKSDGTYGSQNKTTFASFPSPTATYDSYGSSGDLWGETWTPADINDTDFGAGFVASIAKNQNGSDTPETHYLKATNFGFAIPTGSTINGIKVETLRKSTYPSSNITANVDHISITVYYTSAGNLFSQTYTEAITATASLLNATGRTLAETLTATASMVRDVAHILSEPLTSADSIIRTVGRTVAESVTAMAAFTFLRTASTTLSEALTAADNLIRSIIHILIEALAGTDTLVRTPARTLADSATMTDSVLRGPARILTDALTAADTFLRSLVRTLSDAATATDTFESLKVIAATLSEALSTAATLVRAIGRTMTEPITATDILTTLRATYAVFTDVVTATDSSIRQAGRTLTESLTATAFFLRSISRSFTEDIAAAASMIRTASRTFQEALSATSTALFVRMYARTFSEALTAIDAFIGQVRGKMRKGITLLTARGDRTVLQSKDDTTTLRTKNDKTIL
jgi:hypothetical protein